MVDTRKPTQLSELWMELKDRTLLKSLMDKRGLSARELAKRAGWQSHSYMNRLLAGQAKTLNTEPAARIAHELQVPFDLLFVTRTSGTSEQTIRSAKAGRAA